MGGTEGDGIEEAVRSILLGLLGLEERERKREEKGIVWKSS